MRRALVLLLPLFALTALRCAAPADMADDTKMVEPGDLFHISLGETVRIMEPDGTVGARLVFQEVIEDSRCPVDVNCIQAGEARVRLALHDADNQHFNFEARVPGLRPHGVIPDEAHQPNASAYVFHFLRLDPYPTAERTGGDDAPRAIFKVRFMTR